MGKRFSLFSQFVVSSLIAASAAHGGDTTSLSGVVMDDQQNPVGCAALIIEGPDDFRISTTTDDNGVYMMDGLAPGDYIVQVHAPGFDIENSDAKVPQRQRIPVSLESGTPGNLDFEELTMRIDPDFRVIQGLVLLNNENRDPVPDCEMFVRTPDCEIMDVTFTCRSGLYELIVPADLESTVTVSFQLPDFEPVPLTLTPMADGTTMADDILIDLFGDDVGAILGTVTDADDMPINRAEVTIEPATKQAELETNCNGAFRANGLAPGDYAVTVTAPGFETVTETVTVAAGAEPATIALALQRRLFGCASGESGAAGGRAGDFALVVLAATLLYAVRGRNYPLS